MRLNCPQCDHVITGNECDCGFRYVDHRPQQLSLPIPEPPKPPGNGALYEGHPILL